MAEKYGKNYTKAFINTIKEKANVGDWAAKMRLLYDEQDGVLEADTMLIGKLPKGARVLSVNHVGAGTSPSFNVSPTQVMADETIVIVTVGATPAATVKAWVEYTVD